MATQSGNFATQPAGRPSPTVPCIALHTALFVVLLCSFFTPCPAQEPMDPPGSEAIFSYGLETDCNSQYVWHGVVFEDHLVVQPTVWVSAYGFTASVWNNHTPQDEHAFGVGDELDFSLSHELTWRSLTAEAGFDYYTYPHQEEAPATGEASVKLSCKWGPAEFSSSHSLDVIEYQGAYFGDVAAALEHEIIPQLSASATLRMGWASAQFNETYLVIRQAALNFAGAELAATVHISSTFYLRPHAEYFRILDTTIRSASQASITNAGLAVGFEW
jgi:hypothetical protein